MSITLTANVGFADGVLPVTADPGSDRIQVDAEQIDIRGHGDTEILVTRGVNGTVAQAHSADAVVTPVYSVETSTPQATPITGVYTQEATFTETTGDGVFTATIPVPALATVLDVVFRNTVVWNASTSASLVVGDDDDDDGYIAATNVKSAPAADTNGAGAGISTALSLGATAGAYKGGGGKFCATAKTITATITKVGTGSNGRSRLLVKYALPTSTAAVKS